jgi:hypothetical protein
MEFRRAVNHRTNKGNFAVYERPAREIGTQSKNLDFTLEYALPMGYPNFGNKEDQLLKTLLLTAASIAPRHAEVQIPGHNNSATSVPDWSWTLLQVNGWLRSVWGGESLRDMVPGSM